MQPKYVAFIVFTWVLAAFCGGVVEGTLLGANESATLNGLMTWTRIFSEQDFGILELIASTPAFFISLFNMLTFNFSFFQGDWELVRWIILSPIIASIVWGLVSMFIPNWQRSI